MGCTVRRSLWFYGCSDMSGTSSLRGLLSLLSLSKQTRVPLIFHMLICIMTSGQYGRKIRKLYGARMIKNNLHKTCRCPTPFLGDSDAWTINKISIGVSTLIEMTSSCFACAEMLYNVVDDRKPPFALSH